MKEARADRRRVTLRYRHDAVSSRTVLVIDVESPADEMPHEHKHDLKEMAAELLGVPIDALPEGVEVRLKSAHGHDHDHEPGHTHEEERRETEAPGRAAIKQ